MGLYISQDAGYSIILLYLLIRHRYQMGKEYGFAINRLYNTVHVVLCI